MDLLTDDVKPTKINIRAAFKERFGDMLDGDDEMKPDEEEEEDDKKIKLKEKEEEEEKKKVEGNYIYMLCVSSVLVH